MPKFIVRIERSGWEFKDVEVEADQETQAEAKVQAIINDGSIDNIDLPPGYSLYNEGATGDFESVWQVMDTREE